MDIDIGSGAGWCCYQWPVSNPRDPDRRLLVSVELERDCRQDNALRFRSQQVFRRLMAGAVRELGLGRTGWLTQSGGDGELAVLPSAPVAAAVVADLVFVLDRRLARENARRAGLDRVRLRVAIHQGRVHLDGAAGFPGEGVVTVSRLVDAPALRAALHRRPRADVALIVSDPVYRDVVLTGGWPRPDRFHRVGDAPAGWIFVPDGEVTGGGGER